MMQDKKQMYDNETYYLKRAYSMEFKYPILNVIMEVLAENYKPKRVLDIGCAKGFSVYALRNLGIEAYGVDISQYAIDHSPENIREYLQNVDVDNENLPFKSGTIDMVTSLECFEHLQSPSYTIAEIARVLKPGGLVAIGTPQRQAIIAGFFHRYWGNPNLHPSILSKTSWIQLFESQGFTYLKDFIAQEPIEVRDRLRDFKKKHAYQTLPNLKLAKYLKRLGGTGKWARVQLALFFYQFDYLLFKLNK